MQVKINVSIAGTEFAFYPGQIVELDDELAEKWIEAGHASEVEVIKPVRRKKVTGGDGGESGTDVPDGVGSIEQAETGNAPESPDAAGGGTADAGGCENAPTA